MARTYDLSDSIDRMKFRELMGTNWCQKKYKDFAKQLEEYAPYADGMTDLLQGLCYQHGWGVWKNKETARKFFSKLYLGKTVWFGHTVSPWFMECEVVKIEEDRILLREKKPHVMPPTFTSSRIFGSPKSASWHECRAREWMNTSYYENTFYGQERKLIQKVKITTPDNPFTMQKSTVKECTDKVFPLSIQEYMEFRGWTKKIPTRCTWVFSLEGPEAVCVRAGEYVTRITTRETEYKMNYYGREEDLEDMKFKGSTGSFFRTQGSSPDSKAFYIKDAIFYEGENRHEVRSSEIKLGYNPAFWISLK